ncbi:hypothetical protein DP73_13060 [Desulfosporosinus sp. HMP52]|uniref:poly(R)-hydroxyalkanoic acid synthase subunit PhaE n=1 Tax=Desulfosporosinus sp. HMP52 TaxID=1487923 RepID=UPI00051F8BB6|nr:poly(R)-hydroxyalkanoic acid synthase subunit PhaE [Desulfosporosinus sp. HMP52]KGK88220.1 hypothetical protein DP73_13060 [Desulfosporosinus sp. HMP52]
MSENMDFMEMYFENQKKMFDYWQDLMNVVVTPKDKAQGKKEEPNSDFEESLRPTQEMTKQWFEFNDQYLKNISKVFFPLQFNKIFSGANIYQNLYEIWEDLIKTFTGKDSDPITFCNKWIKDYQKLLSSNFIFYLPEQVQNFSKKFIEIYSLSTDTSQKFLHPWLEGSQTLQNLLTKSITGDKTAYIEFVKLWNEKFSSTYGKIFNMPIFSMNRELMQKQMHSINASINFINTMSEFFATMAKVSQETFEKIIKDYQEMLVKGNNPKTFKEFYEYWWKQNEAAYHKLFGTDEFSKLISQVMDAGVNFKKEFDSLLENTLKFLPYPTRTDMDSLYRTLDDLKREVRALKKEVIMLKEIKANTVTIS